MSPIAALTFGLNGAYTNAFYTDATGLVQNGAEPRTYGAELTYHF
jgi:hypothetical protein